MRRAVFLDRDGVINRKAAPGEYVTDWGDMHILPGAVEGIARLRAAGFSIYIVTNQRCVAKGIISASDLEALHERLCRWLAARNAPVDAVYYCPHEVEPPCDCRKPAPGLLLRASAENNIHLKESWMIGDSDIDIEAGRRAGCRTGRILPAGEPCGPDTADVCAGSLLEMASDIVRRCGIP